MSDTARQELILVAPILAQNLKISDRIEMACEIKKLNIQYYFPSAQVINYINKVSEKEIAFILPPLQINKAVIDEYDGEVGESVLAMRTKQMTNEQWHYMLARYLVEIKGMDVFINSCALQADINKSKQGGSALYTRNSSVDEEQLLDIAEVCFVRIADILIKKG